MDSDIDTNYEMKDVSESGMGTSEAQPDPLFSCAANL
jgi:hypothetical protein